MNTNRFGTDIILCMSLFIAMSCTSDETDNNVPSHTANGKYTCRMYLDKEALSGFNPTRSGEEKMWNNGDVVYVQFAYSDFSETKHIAGNAVYHSETEDWELTYNNYIPGEGICEMYFFDPSGSVSSIISIDEQTVVYEDLDATYKKNSKGDLIVHARLEPKTGRLRFKGEANTRIYVRGLDFISSYDVESNEFSLSSPVIPLAVRPDGFTPYLYATSNIDDLSIESDYSLYAKTFNRILSPGKSGVIEIPYPWNYTGWTRSSLFETITVKGIAFKMMHVGAGTFLMGATEEQENPSEDELPLHRVTLTNDYYMGETVVTQALWEAVMGSNPSMDVAENKPVTYVSHSDCLTFIDELNRLTGKKFRLPTEAEWEYAAREGYKSAGYPYSGGTSIDDYAWYKENCKQLQEVKTKQPNALGIYDMSGNVWEWCHDGYGIYSPDDATDPTGTNDKYKVLRGGCYQSAAQYCRTSTRYTNYLPNETYGFRLAF